MIISVNAGGPWTYALSVAAEIVVPMAYDEDLAERLRELLAPEAGLSEKRMFGGLAFLIDGHMAVAVSGQGGLMLRVDPGGSEALINGSTVTRMVMRGREMAGWLRVDPSEVRTKPTLRRWVKHGLAAARVQKR